MKRFYLLNIIIASIAFTSVSIAQDVHYSQFFFAPQSVNPANTGNFNGDWRINNNYRSQWGVISPYSTFTIGADMNRSTKKGKQYGLGILALNDQSSNGSVVVNQLYLSGARAFNLNRHRFRGGVQMGVVNKSLSNNQIRFGDQFDYNTGLFSSEMATAELGYANNISYFDLNVGARWSYNLGAFTPQIGFAMAHIFTTKESYFGDNQNTASKIAVDATTDLKMSEKIYVTPQILYMQQAKATEFMGGFNATYVLSSDYLEKSIFAGVYSRNQFQNFDALIFLVGGNYLNWTVGLSYDVNVSELNALNRNPGGFELSLIYREISTKITKIFIPCERF